MGNTGDGRLPDAPRLTTMDQYFVSRICKEVAEGIADRRQGQRPVGGLAHGGADVSLQAVQLVAIDDAPVEQAAAERRQRVGRQDGGALLVAPVAVVVV